MFKFRKRKEEVELPDQSFVQDVPIEIGASHPLKIRKIARPIFYFIVAAFFVVCGVIGVRMTSEDPSQQSANIAAGIFFFVLAAIFVALMILTYRTKVIVKLVKGEVIGVWVGLRKRIVYLGNKQVYKGKSNVIEVYGNVSMVKVHVDGNIVYFK